MKKLIAGALAALLSFAALAATTTPVSLLNPSGSTAGQAIISTGPSSAPAWGAVPLTGITGTLAIANGGTGATSASAARTNLGLGTSATVNTGTSGATVPLLNGANTWGAAQTFSVRPTFNGATPYDSANLTIANYAPLASPTFTGTVTVPTLSVSSGGASVTGGLIVAGGGASVTGGLTMTSGAITPVSTAGIVGTTTNNNAPAGAWGESFNVTNSGIALTSNVPANCASQALTAGDYEVTGVVEYLAGTGTTVLTAVVGGLNTTSATLGSFPNTVRTLASQTVSTSAGADIVTPTLRFSLAGSATVYLVGAAAFASGSVGMQCLLHIRRAR